MALFVFSLDELVVYSRISCERINYSRAVLRFLKEPGATLKLKKRAFSETISIILVTLFIGVE